MRSMLYYNITDVHDRLRGAARGNSAQQKGGRANDRLFVIPGRAKREPGIHLSTQTGARWIPGSALTRRPGMTR
ncbi:hypothetical protein XI06_36090 [Bradyrhizobium sp. CCBAU 11434]|nr:hypothetical protein [Bradyrhizobium sp. CCBAU 11434]